MTPSTTPPLLGHLAYVGQSPILVTGATGVLGGYVLDELERSGAPARALCHRHRIDKDVDAVPGDLRTGRGLRYALDDLKAIIHVANDDDPNFETQAIANLLGAIDRHAPQTHVVFVSQVGCWESSRMSARTKCDAENLLTQWRGRYSILRSSPGHERVYNAIRNSGIYGGPSALRVTPIDLGFVARMCADTALRHTPLGAPVDMYGPETHTLYEFAQLCAHLEGYRGRVRALKTPVTTSVIRGEVWESAPEQERRRGELATPDDVIRGGVDFAQWWARKHGPNIG